MVFDTKQQSVLHKSRKLQLDKSASYTKQFIDGLDRKNAYIIVNCPTCNLHSSHLLFKKNGGQYVYCNNCEHVYLENQLKESILFEFYAKYPTSSLEWHINESDFYRKIYLSGLDLLPSKPDQSHVLDIGCSSGYFLSIAQEQGYEISGVEPNQKESKYALDNGINIIGSSLKDIQQAQITFDAITLWDVLEHIKDPVNYLKSLRMFLKPNGYVFVQIPTCDSLAARVMQKKCNMFDGIEHLTLFSAKSLDSAFNSADFTKVVVKSVITDYFAFNNYLNYENDPYMPDNDNYDLLHSLLAKDFIESSGLGYKLQACYKIKN